MTNVDWSQMHDATLESLELRWSSGDAELRLRTGDEAEPRWRIVVSAVRRIGCDRHMPWGPSASINEVRDPTAAGDGVYVLEIEMQSGDVIRIEAGAFRVSAA